MTLRTLLTDDLLKSLHDCADGYDRDNRFFGGDRSVDRPSREVPAGRDTLGAGGFHPQTSGAALEVIGTTALGLLR